MILKREWRREIKKKKKWKQTPDKPYAAGDTLASE